MVTASRSLGSNYELIDRLGAGAMGEVWRGRDRRSGEAVAAKLLRSEYAANHDIVMRFLQERAILLSLDHPNIVRIRDLVAEGDSLAIVMDLVDGSDLRAALRDRGTLAPADAASVTVAVLEALAAAHDRGCLHRDVKPDNVLLTGQWATGADGTVRLSDFGIARLAQESTVQATGLLGTPLYMPPELFEHGLSSAASDVYAAGIMLYELLGGRTPYAGPGTAFSIGQRHVTSAPPVLDVPARLWTLTSGLIAKDPAARLTARAAAQALRDLLPDLAGVPALPAQPEPTGWEGIRPTAPASGPIRVHNVDAQVDMGSTNLDASIVADEPLARPGGEAAPMAPGAPVLDAAVTNLAPADVDYTAPALPSAAPALPAHEDRSRPRWWMWVGVGVATAAVVGVAAAVVLPSHGQHHAARAASTVVQASQADDPTAAGLSISRDAQVDPDSGDVGLTLTYASQRAALQGPFFEVVPALSGGRCPTIDWRGATVKTAQSLSYDSGITVACGWSITPDRPLGPQSHAAVTAVVHLGADSVSQDRLEKWLSEEAAQTTAALKVPTSTYYPAQRLEQIEVDVPISVVARGDGTPVRVRLLPVWAGANDADKLDPLYDSSSIGAPTSMLTAITGGAKPVFSSDCDGALQVIGNRIVAMHTADACGVHVEVGNFSADSSSITVTAPGG
jgi:serine/threonine-protein kinase